MPNLQTYYHFQIYFQKVDQHTGGKRLIHDTKRRKDNQLQSMKLLYNILVGDVNMTSMSPKVKCSIYQTIMMKIMMK